MKKIEYSSYPLMAYPLRGFFSLTIIILATVGSFFVVKHVAMPIFTFLIISMPLVNFLFPSKYTFEEECFKKTQLFQEKKVDWDIFTVYRILDDGILLACEINRRKNEYVYIFDKKYFSEIETFLIHKGIIKYEEKA